MRYHTYFLNEDYSLPGAMYFLPDFKPKSLKTSSADLEKKLQSALGIAFGEILPFKKADNETQATLSRSSEPDLAVSVASSSKLWNSHYTRQRGSKSRKNQSVLSSERFSSTEKSIK